MHSSRRAAPQSNAGRFGIRTGAGNNANPWACAGQARKLHCESPFQ
nr:MAG TPA: hypothetical protein [Caudoviricetes sp.]